MMRGMSEAQLSYPVAREARRLKRWLETAGAEYRLVAAVSLLMDLLYAFLDPRIAHG